MKTLRNVLAILLILGIPLANAQYWGERVLEKSFEHSGFFFRPSFVNPYGIGGFGSVAPGLIDEPLLNLQVNPAFLAADSIDSQYAYINFRSTQEIQERDTYFYPCYDALAGSRSLHIYYPHYYAESRKALGTAVFGGMLAATLFGVFMVPVLYVVVRRTSDWLSGNRPGAPEPQS